MAVWQRVVMLYREVDAGGAAQLVEPGLAPARVALHLVDGRGHARDGEQGLQLPAGEVADADGARPAGLVQRLHRRPRRGDVTREGVLAARHGSFLDTDWAVDLRGVGGHLQEQNQVVRGRLPLEDRLVRSVQGISA